MGKLAENCTLKHIYDFVPDGREAPPKPAGYDDLLWADCLPPCENLRNRLEERLRSCPKSNPARSKDLYGWHFEPARA